MAAEHAERKRGDGSSEDDAGLEATHLHLAQRPGPEDLSHAFDRKFDDDQSKEATEAQKDPGHHSYEVVHVRYL